MNKILRKLEPNLSFARSNFISPSFPKNDDGKVLLNIGCGDKTCPEFINIDARPLANIHIIADNIASLVDFGDGTVDLIYMSHVLEHVKRGDLKRVLVEMKRVLKNSGVIRFSVPDFDRLIEVYNLSGKDINAISQQLMGGQDDEYNIHYCVFNQQYLSKLLKDVGFQKVVEWDPDNCSYHNFKDCASRALTVNGKKYRISLNLEAIK